MRKTYNRLLITLVLFGVLVMMTVRRKAVHAATSSVGKLPADPIGKSVYDPPPAPTAGEPDVGQTAPQRNDLSSTRVGSQSSVWTSSPRTIKLTSADAIRWAWVIWMAQYLNQLP